MATFCSQTYKSHTKNLALNKSVTLDYQATQDEKGKVKIEQRKPDMEVILREELKKYFKMDIDFEIT